MLKYRAIYPFVCYMAKIQLIGTSQLFFWKLYTMLYNIKECYITQ